LVIALSHHLDITLHIETRGARQAAGGFIGFLNGKCARNGLSIFFIGRFAVTEPLVVFAGKGNRTDFRTVTAAGALGWIDVTGLLGDEGLEVSFRSFNFINFSACDQIDIEMPADLDQFR
jgi:hypothetical protein